MLYSHILVPTDFSSAANRALAYAFEEATQHQARLTLLHVLQHHPSTEVYYIKDAPQSGTGYVAEFGEKLPAFPSQPPETVRRDYYEEALVQLQDLVPASFTGTREVEVAAGHPAETIVRMARELAVDLIIMATHGRTGVSHLLLGSVAEHVVRHAPCPVLTVRQQEQRA
jgi:nucleotide-binding universal stress UspA family protein